MERLKKRFTQADDVVIDHVYNVIAAGNETFAIELLQTMSPADIRELKKNLSNSKEEKKENVKHKKVAGLSVKETNENILHKEVFHEVSISNFIASVKTTQSFVNERENPVEMVFRFAGVSKTKCVNNVEIETYDPKTKEKKRMKARVTEKERAKEEYDDAIASGNSAFVVEKKEEEKLVSLNLGNIQPGVEVKVDIFAAQELKVVEKNSEEVKIKFCLDSVLNTVEEGENLKMERGISGKVIENMKVKINIKEISGEIKKIEIPSIQKEYSNDFKKSLEFDSLSPSKDFNVLITVKNFPVSNCLIKDIKTEGSFQYKQVAMLNVLPKNDNVEHDVSTEFLVVIDCSGSMAGSRMRCAKEALLFFLQSLDAEDKIKLNIISFGSHHKKLFNRPETLDTKIMQRAKDFTNRLDSNMGGTNLFTPLNEILQVETTPGFSRQILVLTDGETDNPLQIIKQIKEFSGNTRIMCAGIGNDVNQFFLRNLAEITNGRSVFLSKSDEINEKLLELLEYCLQPSLHNINVVFPKEFGKVEKVVNKTPLVYFNEVLTQYYFIQNKPEKDDLKIEMEFKIGESKKNSKMSIPYKSSEDEGIEILAANSMINELTKFGKNPKEDKTKILEFGLKFNLLTSETSFFLEIENNDSQQKEMKVENINTIQYVNNSKIDNPIDDSWGDLFSSRSNAPVPTIGFDKFFDRGNRLEELEDEADELEGSSLNFSAKASKQKKKGNFQLFGGGGFFGKKKKSKKSTLSASKPLRLKQEEKMERANNNLLDFADDNFEAPQEVAQSLDFFFEEEKTSNKKKKKKSKKDKKEQFEPPKKPSIKSITGGPLNKIIFSQEMNGCWTFNEELNEFLKIDLKKIMSEKPKEINKDLWFSMIVVAVLEKKFSSEKAKWKLIVKKTMRFLKKNNNETGKYIEMLKKSI